MKTAVCVLCLVFVINVLAINNGLARTPTMGWNTWCTGGTCGYDVCTEDEIKSVANAMIDNGMQALGYDYINLDDCWADHRDAQGNIVEDMSRFPTGIANTIAWLHARNFRFGLYTDAGLYTCSSGQRPHQIPGSYGHYQQDANSYAKWGVDYVKMDWCNTKINGTQLDPRVQYPQMSHALNSTGRAILFEMCEWGVDQPWTWGAPIANSWRMAGDHHDNWQSTSGVIEQNANLSAYAGPGAWNDMDFLMTGGQGCPKEPMSHCPGQSDTEYRTEFALWALLNSPLLVATDVRKLTPIMQEVLFNKEIIAVSQDPLGNQGERVATSDPCSDKDACQVWTKHMSTGAKAVVLYNAATRTNDITLTSKDLGWGSTVHFRDLWAHTDNGTFTDHLTVSVPSHGNVMLLVTGS
eukprot:TRINITY_DN415_c0_g1_i1.p1 TRINITY_DN415_c0_g1~~TRINITY_DN415_c0_g1_i1.p1  ORF type:complete len:409 (-),score=80.08 TRINITY_DN415_c0_g1_i1:32-1258(-)